jgi:hypothetical protein
VTHILWLASYPKSGNTWLRAFLANYLSNGESEVAINTLPTFAVGDMRAEPYAALAGRPAAALSRAEINRLRPAVHRRIAGSRPGILFVKTHSVLGAIDDVPTITPDVTFGALYIVRNPLDVAVSFADHYGLTPAQGVRALCFKGLEIEPKEGHIRQVVADWTSHVESWEQARGLYRLSIRYEDMLTEPEATFGQVLAFLRLRNEPARLRRAIERSSFRALAAQEERGGFVERSKNARWFFRRGAAGGWRQVLDPADVELLIACHRQAMQAHGYLDADGQVLP